jgi:hypothetical protein
MTIKDKLTTKGGNRSYSMTRSKIAIDPKTGYGKVVTLARETLMRKLGRDPGPNVVAAHKSFGAHHSHNPEEQQASFKSRAYNTAESNMNRDHGISMSDKIKLRKYKK